MYVDWLKGGLFGLDFKDSQEFDWQEDQGGPRRGNLCDSKRGVWTHRKGTREGRAYLHLRRALVAASQSIS